MKLVAATGGFGNQMFGYAFMLRLSKALFACRELNTDPEKIVIVPERWWNGLKDDVVPDTWLRLM